MLPTCIELPMAAVGAAAEQRTAKAANLSAPKAGAAHLLSLVHCTTTLEPRAALDELSPGKMAKRYKSK